MCVIVVRNPQVDIPFEKISSACEVNPDGWGISVVDRGKIETYKAFNDKGNDPEHVARALEAAKDHRVYLHLRYATRGSKNAENCHPFSIVKTDEYEAMLMHNGTLGDFGNKDMTDSEDFGRQIVSPLISRALYETDDPLNDNFVQTIIKKYGGGSRFVLYDSNGKDFIHGTGGDSKWHDDNGWWSSNVYSFNRTHRSGGSSYKTYGHGWVAKGGSQEGTAPFAQGNDACAIPPATTTRGATSATATTASSSDMRTDPIPSFPKREPVDPQPVLSFCDIAGLTSLSELVDLTDEQIKDILKADVEIGVAMVRDLLWELYGKAYWADGDDDE